jgi:hypothetical protein
VSLLTLRLLSVVISDSSVEGFLLESILRYWTSLSESLEGHPNLFEFSILCCCYHSVTISAACGFDISVISAISL